MRSKESLIVALDVFSFDEMVSIVQSTQDEVRIYKVGHQLFTAEGLAISRVRKEENKTYISYVYEALQRWLSTQSGIKKDMISSFNNTCNIYDGVLIGFSEIKEKRNSEKISVSVLETRISRSRAVAGRHI